MAFERFTEYGRGYRPTASLRTNGQIGFNRGSIHHFSLRDGYVVLYYDRESRIIGVQQVADRNEEGAIRLIVKGNNAFVSARTMLEFYDIPYRDSTTIYPAERSDEHDMVLIDLNRPLRKRSRGPQRKD